MNDLVKPSPDTGKPKLTTTFFAALACLVLLPGESLAEIYKCKDAKGKVQYSDTQCPAAIKTDISNNPSPAVSPNTHSSPNERILSIYIQEAIANKEYKRAASLAVTPAQFAMIREAQERDAKAKSNYASPPGRDIGQCMGDCASEQGICSSQCQGNGQCYGNCGAVHGRCVARCN
jgi:hypothetical protein